MDQAMPKAGDTVPRAAHDTAMARQAETVVALCRQLADVARAIVHRCVTATGRGH